YHPSRMDVRDVDCDLPPELIAQEPAAERSAARLLHLDRATGALAHTRVDALPDLLSAGDLLVVNDTRVFPARLLGRRVPSGGGVECLLVRRESPVPTGVRPVSDPCPTGARSVHDTWEALVHPGQN